MHKIGFLRIKLFPFRLEKNAFILQSYKNIYILYYRKRRRANIGQYIDGIMYRDYNDFEVFLYDF